MPSNRRVSIVSGRGCVSSSVLSLFSSRGLVLVFLWCTIDCTIVETLRGSFVFFDSPNFFIHQSVRDRFYVDVATIGFRILNHCFSCLVNVNILEEQYLDSRLGSIVGLPCSLLLPEGTAFDPQYGWVQNKSVLLECRNACPTASISSFGIGQ